MTLKTFKVKAKARLRLAVLRTGSLYLRLRRLEGLIRYLTKRPHDRDFEVFGRLGDSEGLFLDVGANAGLAAVSFRIFRPRSPILCVEPNPGHRRDLQFTARVIGSMRYIMCGASDEASVQTLYIPEYRGVPITPLATFDREQVEADWRLDILFGGGFNRDLYEIREHSVEVRRLDDLNLEPAFVKIDVEGLELSVLRGLEQTLDRHRPAIMLEWTRGFDEVQSFLEGKEYGAHVLDESTGNLVRYDKDSKGLNVFCLPRERSSASEPGAPAPGPPPIPGRSPPATGGSRPRTPADSRPVATGNRVTGSAVSRLVPPCSVTLASGGMLIGIGLFGKAYALFPEEPDAGRLLFWIALALVVSAFTLAAVNAPSSFGWAIALCVLLALALYAPKFFRTPDAFIFFDELQHVRATEDLLAGQGFASNSLNPVIPSYPGLHLLTAGVAQVLGTSTFTAGNLVLVLARVGMLIALYVLFLRIVRTSSQAMLAVIAYAANPAYLFFDAQFSYESLSLPLSLGALALAVAGADRAVGQQQTSLIAAIGLGLIAVVTHHISTYSIAAVMLLGAGCAALFEPQSRAVARRLAIVGATTALGSIAWVTGVATNTFEYLGGDIGETLGTIPSFITGEGSGRAPFAGSPFQVPLYERVLSLAGVALLALLFISGILLVRHDRQRRGRWIACALLGSLFFLSLPLQLLQDAGAAPIAPRIWEIAFLGLAPIVAMSLSRVASIRRVGRTLAASAAVIIVMSGTTIRSGDNIRFPGGYIASAGPLAATPDVLDAARWLERHAGPKRKIMADVTVAAVFGAYARSDPRTYQNFGYRPWRVFFGARLSGAGRYELDRSKTEFVVVDKRITSSRPFGGYYFAPAEPRNQPSPLPRSFIRKFNTSESFKRIFVGQNVRIYRYLPGHRGESAATRTRSNS